MNFTKMQGAGNDFIIIDDLDSKYNVNTWTHMAQVLCKRKKSIGADGLMVVQKSQKGCDFKLTIYNADGSEAEMCGNGARCIARYGYEHKLAGETMKIETLSGIVEAERISKRLYRIKLNNPSVIKTNYNLVIDNKKYDCTYIELGVPGLPHAVVRLDDFDTMDEAELFKLGRKMRYADVFPKGANINFYKLLDDGTVKLKTYERGVEDFTLACGTGTGSTALTTILKKEINTDSVKLFVPGGELRVHMDFDNDKVDGIYLTGDTNIIAVGTIMDEDL